MKRIRRAIIVLIAMGLVVSLTMVIPASAQNRQGSVKVLDSEFVLATIDSAGEIEEFQVFNILSLDGDGTVSVRQEKAFDDVGSFQGVKGFTTPRVEGDYIVWPDISVSDHDNVIATTKLSEPMVAEARTRIPLDVDFRYWFDGERVSDLETITGKSGHFEMELTLTNTSGEKQQVTYTDTEGETKTEMMDVYMPLVILPYDWVWDNKIFFNVETDPTGLVVSRPDNFSTGWSIPLFPPATEESHTIRVEADVKGFMMPCLTLVVSFHFPQSNQANVAETLAPIVKMFYDGLVQVNEGIGSPETDPSLLFGLNAISGGLAQFATALPEAKAALDTQLIPGVSDAVAGIGSPTTGDTLLYATSAVIGGLQEISGGIGSPTTDATALFAMNAIIEGLTGISGGLSDEILPAILELIKALNNPDAVSQEDFGLKQGLEAMKWGLDAPYPPPPGDNPGAIGALWFIYNNVGPASKEGTILNSSSELVRQMTIDDWPGFWSPFNLSTLYAVVNNAPGIDDSNDLFPPFGFSTKDVLNLYLDTIGSGAADGLPQLQLMYEGLGLIVEGLVEMSMGMGQMIEGLEDATGPAGIPQLYAGLSMIRNGIGSSVLDPDTLLFAAGAIEQALKGIKGGIGDVATGETLLYALAAVQGGLTQLKAGLASGDPNNPGLKEGLAMISAGLGAAVAGVGSPETPDTLLYASNAVADGLFQLKEEGTGQLEDGLAMVMDNFAATNALLDAIKIRGEEFDHILGSSDSEESRVAFIYQMKPTYSYTEGSVTSWIVAIVLSVIIALLLVAGGLLLARRSTA